MKKIYDYLNELKNKKGIESDYGIAKYLEMSKGSISAIRNGGSIKDETAIRIADELEIDLSEILLAATAQRTHNERLRKAWEKISKLSGIAAGFFIVFQSTTPFSLLLELQECILC